MSGVLIAGGGTGGHVFPMLAVGAALRAESPVLPLHFVGTGRGIEARAVPAEGHHLHRLDVLPLRGQGLRGFLRGAVRALGLLPEARALVKKLAPDVVFSVGGYAAGPVVLAAWSLGVPVTLLEPNAVLGFTNRLLLSLVVRVYTAFPEVGPRRGRARVRQLGVPLRRRFEPQPAAVRDGRVRVLVLGGSQGAKALNESVPRALARVAERVPGLEVVHQTGREREAGVRELYAELGLAARAEVRGFIDDVASELGAADLVVGRAGASSTSEICAVGRAALLVPYPFAADDHQRRNAESLARDGAARCVVQSEATVERLAAELGALASDGAARVAMAERARLRGRPEAARAVARDLLGIAEERRARAGRPGARA
ncbi:MAG: undecaprenyldiphospho-muramoylpentapeptide beta-N-acetylglucosaminyltransferase, partial [Myxococcales bacterium]|nr:undecaprenyldiphospho-muramoylpentapeptide beta-N-acetylglucosaminyltransferase [Myxococcales bacterium]